MDTSGNIDLPVDERDTDSRVGFSHNSLREYLVAEAIREEVLDPGTYSMAVEVQPSDATGEFLAGMVAYRPEIRKSLTHLLASVVDNSLRAWAFRVAWSMIQKDPGLFDVLGRPAKLNELDLVGLDFSGLFLRDAVFDGSLLADTNFHRADVRGASFSGCIIENVMVDGSQWKGADLTRAEVISIFGEDIFDSGTQQVMRGTKARQWLFSSGANVAGAQDLNPLLGQTWYTATREVARTLVKRIAGTHNDAGLVNGVDEKERGFAEKFVDYLKSKGILEKVREVGSGRQGKWVVKVSANYRAVITDFERNGTIGPDLKPFFDRELSRRGFSLENTEGSKARD